MLTSAARPTAVISGSNGVFPGVLRAIRAHSLEIPRDISLIAIDDLLVLELLEADHVVEASRTRRRTGCRRAAASAPGRPGTRVSAAGERVRTAWQLGAAATLAASHKPSADGR